MTNVEIAYDEENPLNGAISYLRDKYPNSIEVSVSSSTNNTDPESLIRPESSGGYWESASNKPNPWFQIKFKNMKLNAIGYVLKSTYHTSGTSYPNSWILAGSNDEENWETLDQVDDKSDLIEANHTAAFECSEKETEEPYSIFRFQMTEPTVDCNWIFRLSKVELFGDLIIEQSEKEPLESEQLEIKQSEKGPLENKQSESQKESEIEQLKKKIQELEANNEQLTNKTRELETDNKQLTNKTRELETDNEQLTNKTRELETDNKQLTNKTHELETDNEQLKSYLSVLKEKISNIEFINLDDYIEESEIGGGAKSSVKVVVKKSHEKFAKKELKEFDHKTFQRFLSEAEILFKLPHPCIIRIHGMNYGDKNHHPSILLSLEPNSLEKAINNKILNEEQKNRITVEIVLGMRFIHSRNFMHRDLKPLNILLSKNLHVKISDFGFAKEEDLSVSQSKGVGTLLFMAPELYEENDSENSYTNKVDVYSFGITLIFIVSNEYPRFNMNNVLNGVMPTLPASISDWVRELIFRCLSPSPDERPSFAEIFEIMKSNDYDLFSNKGSKLTTKQKKMKNEIEKRILKIEAFEYQHRDE
ncbi:hypothetical protein M9Y10_010336 [Tritrichomonas musculus]|uniref:mitogen-activated protein kinase kinase n=1 Tax=Tritrichomonas musculus TaxID=1915356 RepID=A0ABR2IMA1_9EUKA